jgi:hypothetical protein
LRAACRCGDTGCGGCRVPTQVPHDVVSSLPVFVTWGVHDASEGCGGIRHVGAGALAPPPPARGFFLLAAAAPGPHVAPGRALPVRRPPPSLFKLTSLSNNARGRQLRRPLLAFGSWATAEGMSNTGAHSRQRLRRVADPVPPLPGGAQYPFALGFASPAPQTGFVRGCRITALLWCRRCKTRCPAARLN